MLMMAIIHTFLLISLFVLLLHWLILHLLFRYLKLFFIKQKTTYELLISVWSADVCSSNLKMNMAVGRRALDVVAALQSPFQIQKNNMKTYTRSEERRVRKECVSPCRSRWSRKH